MSQNYHIIKFLFETFLCHRDGNDIQTSAVSRIYFSNFINNKQIDILKMKIKSK